MLTITLPWRARLRVPIREVWFPRAGDSVSVPAAPLPFPLRMFHVPEKVDGVIGRWQPRHSLVTELDAIDNLAQQIRRSTRYEIKRALERDGLRIVDDWTPEQMCAFADEWDAENPNRPSLARMRAFARRGRLSIRAMLLDDRPLCAHAIVDDGRIARGLHSNAARRHGDKELAAQVGRANKALYFRDLFFLRERGIRRFDWGGMSGAPGNGIDELKRAFRGDAITEWVFEGVSAPTTRVLAF